MKINYKLKIHGERQTFSSEPKIINPIESSESKIFQIKAPSGLYGKTALLNIISYACFADKLDDKKILKSVKEGISKYSNDDDYELSYNINFNLPDGNVLKLKKDSKEDRCFEIDGETKYDYNELHKSISVLYDVPTDPSKRLNGVINDIGFWNKKLYSKLKTYWEFLRDIQSDLQNIKDETKITSFIKLIEQLDNEIEIEKKALQKINDSISQVKVIQDLKSLVKEYQTQMSLEEKMFSAKKRFKKIQKPVNINQKDESIITNLQTDKNKCIIEVETILKQFLTFISESPELYDLIKGSTYLTNSFNIIRNVKIDKLIESDSQIDDSKELLKSINQLEEDISLHIRNEQMGKKFASFQFLKQLLEQIDLLIEHDAEEIIEDITNIKSNTLIDGIKKNISLIEMPDYSELKIFFKDKLPKIKSLMKDLFQIKVKLYKQSNKKGIDEDGERYYKLKTEIDVFKEKMKERTRDINSLKYSISQLLSIDVSSLSSFDKSSIVLNSQRQIINNNQNLNDLSGFLKSKNNSLKIKEEQILKLEESKKLNEVRLELEQNKSNSKFTVSEQENLDYFTRQLGMMLRNIGEFNVVIDSIDNENLSSFTDKADQDFIKVAGKVIAYSMDNKLLRPEGEYIRLENYDMLKKEFQCENEIRIKKDDISTGLASGNYLRQRIENTDGDYVIVLLDEIGNMDGDILGEVIRSIKKLDDQKRLILSLLTTPKIGDIEITEF